MAYRLYGPRNRNLHLLAGVIAAGLSAAFFKHKTWRFLFGGAAAVELGVAAYRAFQRKQPAETTETPVSESLQSEVVDGVRMKWEEHGDAAGIPVVLVHGFPTCPRLWRFVIPRLAFSGARCLAWEMVGFGSSWPESFQRDISVAAQADYLYAWLRHMNINKAIFVGHDLGGGVVQRLAIKHPGYCIGLALIDSVAYVNWPLPLVRFARSRSAIVGRLPLFLLKNIFVSALVAVGHDKKRRGMESMEIHWRNYNHDKGPAIFLKQLKSFENKDTLEIAGKLSKIKAPVKVIWGEMDRLDIESGRKLAAEFGAELTVIPGAGHYTPEDHPEEIANAIKDLLSQTEENEQVKSIMKQ